MPWPTLGSTFVSGRLLTFSVSSVPLCDATNNTFFISLQNSSTLSSGDGVLTMPSSQTIPNRQQAHGALEALLCDPVLTSLALVTCLYHASRSIYLLTLKLRCSLAATTVAEATIIRLSSCMRSACYCCSAY